MVVRLYESNQIRLDTRTSSTLDEAGSSALKSHSHHSHSVPYHRSDCRVHCVTLHITQKTILLDSVITDTRIYNLYPITIFSNVQTDLVSLQGCTHISKLHKSSLDTHLQSMRIMTNRACTVWQAWEWGLRHPEADCHAPPQPFPPEPHHAHTHADIRS